MQLALYAHPFSSYCQKVLIALYENDTPFAYRRIGIEDDATAEFAALSPFGKMPVLVDDGQTVLESSIIIEHLQQRHGGKVRLIPEEPDAAMRVRLLDRVFDTYVMTPMQKIVLDHLRPQEARDPFGVSRARELLDTAYRWLDGEIAKWAFGADGGFTLADCAAAPSLFYADWAHEIGPAHSRLRDYRARLLARPSVARAVDEARPFRQHFPPGAPDRD